jgi:hypothetical protein
MARPWTDPRDGTRWLVEAMPFDLGPPDTDGRPLAGWTLVFAGPKDYLELPVGYELGANVSRLHDRELITLLDAAR